MEKKDYILWPKVNHIPFYPLGWNGRMLFPNMASSNVYVCLYGIYVTSLYESLRGYFLQDD